MIRRMVERDDQNSGRCLATDKAEAGAVCKPAARARRRTSVADQDSRLLHLDAVDGRFRKRWKRGLGLVKEHDPSRIEKQLGRVEAKLEELQLALASLRTLVLRQQRGYGRRLSRRRPRGLGISGSLTSPRQKWMRAQEYANAGAASDLSASSSGTSMRSQHDESKRPERQPLVTGRESFYRFSERTSGDLRSRNERFVPSGKAERSALFACAEAMPEKWLEPNDSTTTGVLPMEARRSQIATSVEESSQTTPTATTTETPSFSSDLASPEPESHFAFAESPALLGINKACPESKPDAESQTGASSRSAGALTPARNGPVCEHRSHKRLPGDQSSASYHVAPKTCQPEPGQTKRRMSRRASLSRYAENGGRNAKPGNVHADRPAGCSCPSCHNFFTVFAEGCPIRFNKALQKFSRHQRARTNTSGPRPPPTPRFWRRIEFSSPEVSPRAEAPSDNPARNQRSAPAQCVRKL
ncbi:hypothetical protein CCYA_CCYA07G2103 [Cyanidiococcus yangmingshanensis]|nr:hypothetical protein CCYA_CCYA07G2103 [Cyanidiococcus yangmingshanensis]